VDDGALRELVPQVLAALVRRGADFATAEDAVQEALVRAMSAWADQPPDDPRAWLVTVAWRRFLDLVRSDTARAGREERVEREPRPGEVPGADDTLQLYFLCAHPDLTPSSAVALTLRAVGGLTTRQVAQAYLVPESTMAQRISRAKRTVAASGVDRPGDVRTVMRVLYLVFNEGYSGDVDLASEAIRLTRQLAALVDHAEVDGLLALMLLHHARRASRTGADGRLVPLAEQDRRQWDAALIAEGTGILHRALARDQLGEYQAQAAIAALHADAPSVEDTDWTQIVEWYDELLRLADTPIVRLNRAVAVGEASGAVAGLAALAEVDPSVPRRDAVAAHLHERNGELEEAARLYALAARHAPSLPEREHQTRQAARVNQLLRERVDTHALGYERVDDDPNVDVLLDTMEATAAWPATRRLRAWELERLGVRPGQRVLDVGCGRGDVTGALASGVGAEGGVVGLDASAQMLGVARARVGAAAFLVGDACALAAREGAFDAVRSERTLQWLPDPGAAVAEMGRVLRAGGLVGLIDTDWSTFAIDIGDDDLARRVREAMRVERNRPSNIGRRLHELVQEHGFELIDRTSETERWTSWDPDESVAPAGCFSMASLADDLVDAGQLDETERAGFVSTVHAAARAGRFSMTLTMFAVVARKR
jgi:RNA polymerase sigma factor (sigma-70 family)